MSPEPDLTAELDAAEDIVMGRAEAVVTEWGSRARDGGGDVFSYGVGGEASALSVIRARRRVGKDDVLVRRTVTYGSWEPVNDSAPTAAVREDEEP